MPDFIKNTPLEKLAEELAFSESSAPLIERPEKPFSEWKMELDDAPILRYLYRNFQPERHLEFGTWQGVGACLCLEECEATVWTLNLPFGEDLPDGTHAYQFSPEERLSIDYWAKTCSIKQSKSQQTDALGFIGRFFLAGGYGHRVNQIYADSRDWDPQVYPGDFFDSALIDGGHQPEIVQNDSLKALSVLRSGGMIIWHDYLPEAIEIDAPTTHGVRQGIRDLQPLLGKYIERLLWVEPSMILIGIRNGHPFEEDLQEFVPLNKHLNEILPEMLAEINPAHPELASYLEEHCHRNEPVSVQELESAKENILGILSSYNPAVFFWKHQIASHAIFEAILKILIRRGKEQRCTILIMPTRQCLELLRNYPLVSIITPSFNNAEFLERCIESVIKQEYPNVEMLVQDAGSTDGSLEILERYNGQVDWISEPDNGQSDGLNRALQRCRGEIIGVLNADDEYLPQAANFAVEHFASNPELGVVYGDQYNVAPDGTILQEWRCDEYDFIRVLCCETVLPAQAAFIRRSALENVGFHIDVTRPTCPDYEYWVRIGLKFPMAHKPGFLAKYRWHPGSEGRQVDIIHKMVDSKREVADRILCDPEAPQKIIKLRRRIHSGILWWGAMCMVSNRAIFAACTMITRSVLIYPHPRQLSRLSRIAGNICYHLPLPSLIRLLFRANAKILFFFSRTCSGIFAIPGNIFFRLGNGYEPPNRNK